MRCIEMHTQQKCEEGHTGININMRCIEILKNRKPEKGYND